jgi:hypothetical protein
MIRGLHTILLSICVFHLLQERSSVHSAEQQTATPTTSTPNAAVIYWQAFSCMPSLTSEQQKVFDQNAKSLATPLPADIEPILLNFNTALHELHRARSVATCDWMLDEAAGPRLLLPHLAKARQLSHASLLRARWRFANKETDAALDDVLDTLHLARSCGSRAFLISYLVDVAIEKNATDVLAANLHQFAPKQLEMLSVALTKLPVASKLEECVQREDHSFGGWLEQMLENEAKKLQDPAAGYALITAIYSALGTDFPPKHNPTDPQELRYAEILKTMTVQEVRDAVQRLRTDYDKLANIISIQKPETRTALENFEKELTQSKRDENRKIVAQHVFSAVLLPSILKVYDRSVQHDIRHELLKLAIEIQRRGPEALKAETKIKVEYNPTASGFELRGTMADQSELITVGSVK